MPCDVKESRPCASFYNGIDCCRKGGGGEATEEAAEGEEVVGKCLNITLRNFCSPVMPKSASTAATSSWVAKVISTFTFGMFTVLSNVSQLFLSNFIPIYIMEAIIPEGMSLMQIALGWSIANFFFDNVWLSLRNRAVVSATTYVNA